MTRKSVIQSRVLNQGLLLSRFPKTTFVLCAELARMNSRKIMNDPLISINRSQAMPGFGLLVSKSLVLICLVSL